VPNIVQYSGKSILRIVRNISICSLLYCALTAASAAEVLVRHGTVIGVVYNSRYIIVAADGREVDRANRPVNDRKCKIARLDDSHFFFSFGRVRFTDLARKVLADAHDGARQVFRPAQSVHALSETWASRMEKDLQKVARIDHRSVASAVPSKSIVQGVFGGSDAPGRLAMSKADIGYSPPATANIALNHLTQDLAIDDSGTLQLFGIDEVGPFVGEFLANQTPRAKDLQSRLTRDIEERALGPIDARALALKRALEFSIAAANDPRVGGDVSVLVAERDQPIRWFYQAAGCR
jgi:hypothetical protein